MSCKNSVYLLKHLWMLNCFRTTLFENIYAALHGAPLGREAPGHVPNCPYGVCGLHGGEEHLVGKLIV